MRARVAVTVLLFCLFASSGRSAPTQAQVRVCTLFGGSQDERVQGIWKLQNGDIVVAGETRSDFNAAPYPQPPIPFYDESLNTNGGQTDAYVAVLDEELQIKYWTYLGGNGQERAYFAMEEPTSNDIWVCGFTSLSKCTTTADAFPMTHCYKNGGYTSVSCGPPVPPNTNDPTYAGWDVFVVQLSFDLRTLKSSTIIGGGKHEASRGTLWVDVEPNGDVVTYVSGTTLSTDFPYTLIAPSPGVGNCAPGTPPPDARFLRDAFLAKIDNDGVLKWATCLGSGTVTQAFGNVRVDANHDVFIAGGTYSALAPAGAIVYRPFTGSAGKSDGFVAKYSSAGSPLAVTHIGGTNTDSVGVNDCMELDAQGRPIVIGATRSATMPVTTNALNMCHSSCTGTTVPCPCTDPPDDDISADIFIARFSADLANLEYCSYVNRVPGSPNAATEREEAAGLAWHRNNIYFSGETRSQYFPKTGNAFDGTISAAVAGDPNCHDGFIVKLFPGTTGSSVLHYSTFYGGNCCAMTGGVENGTRGRSVSVIGSQHCYSGHVLLGGMTTTQDFGVNPACPPSGCAPGPQLTTQGVAIPLWECGDQRAGVVEVHEIP